MKNPFDKYTVNYDACITKFEIKLLEGEIYTSDNDNSKIKINLKVDTYIPMGTNIIQSLDFNLYAMNNRSDTPSPDGFERIKPAAGIKANVNELINSDNPKLQSNNGVFQWDHTFELKSPFIGTNFNLLGVNIVINRESLKDGEMSRENLFSTVIPAYYLQQGK